MKASLRFAYSFALPLCLLWIGLASRPGAHAASFVTNGPLITPRFAHTATLLPNGKVLVVGGTVSNITFLASAELYDPTTGTWTNTGALNLARRDHTATLLQNGKVLVAGGGWDNNANSFNSAELYDPVKGTWTNTGAMTFPRATHTATLLSNGRVLVTGGTTGNIYLSNAEIYDPANGTWTAVTNVMSDQRFFHTATLLPGGKVYVAGGAGGVIKSSADLFNPTVGNWTATGPLQAARCFHTATLLPNGLVLITGGGVPANTQPAASTAEVFDPIIATSSFTNSMSVGRQWHTATLLPNGQVLVSGGHNGTNALRSIELFDSTSGTWTMIANGLNAARYSHTATLLANGKVLIAGGSNGTNALSSTELYDLTINPATGTWTSSGAMTIGRYACNATLLPNGKVLVAGGFNNGVDLSSAELYDPATGAWNPTAPMNDAGFLRTMTVLPDGKVLVTGGENSLSGGMVSVELHDPATETWTTNTPFSAKRMAHTATLLPNGKVLLAGGSTNIANSSLSITELYDPTTGTRTVSSSLNTARRYHTATLLQNGKVLVAGGFVEGTGGIPTDQVEVYNPATGKWINTGSLTVERGLHTATLLPNGKVFVAGGVDRSNALSSAELYDPISETWTTNGVSSMITSRKWHAAILLSDGKVAVIGGASRNGTTNYSTVELFDPVTGGWTAAAAMAAARKRETTTLLPNGCVLVTGTPGYLPSTELYDPGLGFSDSWRPQIASATSPVSLGTSLSLAGSQFRGIAQGSGGNAKNSPADYPLVQMRGIESGQTTFLLATNWSTNSFASIPVWNFPAGWALATVFVNGIQSTSSIVNISVPVPTPPLLTGAKKLNNGSFQFTFTNSVGAVFGAMATTNLSLPFTNWTALGGVTEILPGQFQFIDPQATNNPRRFYGVRAP